MEEKKTTKKPATKTTKSTTKKPTAKVEAKKVEKPGTTKSATTKTASVKSAATKTKSKMPAKKVEKPAAKVKAPAKVEAKKVAVKAPAKKVEKPQKKAVTKKPANKKVETKKVETKKPTSKKVEKNSKKIEKNVKKVVQKPNFEPKFTYIDGYKGLKLHTAIYDKVDNPKAVVVIIHGMQEHCARYDDFAKFLNAHNYIVIATDLRGHGHTMQSKEEYGVGEKDIFKECLQDQMRVIDFAKTYNLPLYIFGHSYGSMLTQNLVQMSPLVEKAVLCGTTNGDCMQFRAGSCLISLMSPFKNQDKRGGLAEKLCIESYGKGFENGNWFSRDEKVFEAYKADEFCGGTFPFSFYRSLIKNMRKTNDGIRKARGKKLFLIAGDKDPVGQQGKQVRKLLKIYLRNNVDAKMKLYSGARHELLNETNKDEVYRDVLKFFEE